jgi:histidyl-tRNA synthetase
MVAYFGEEEKLYGLKVLRALRENNIPAEIYPEVAKIQKQLTYADKKNIPFVVIVGSEEMKTGKLTVKNMVTGSQEILEIRQIVEMFL